MWHSNGPKGFWVLLVLLIGVSGRILQQIEDNGGEEEEINGKGFLTDELPFRITATTPVALVDGDQKRVLMRRDQPITVIFTRPVVALGEGFGTALSDDKIPFVVEPRVPGRYQWVSSHIFMFNPKDGWPLDSEANITWNEELTTHDGIILEVPEKTSIELFTSSLQISIEDVKSELATSATDGLWDSMTGAGTDDLPEIPADGIATLRFSHPVSMDVLEQDLKVLDENSTVVPVKLLLESCEGSAENEMDNGEIVCAVVSLDDELPSNKVFSFALKPGVEYSAGAGALKKHSEAKFGSLRKFQFPFVDGDITVGSKVLDIWIPHGLAHSQSLEEIKANMRLSNPLTGEQVDYNLSKRNYGTLRLNADIEPGNNYRLNVVETDLVLDAMNQSLHKASLDFVAGPTTPQLEMLQTNAYTRLAIFEADGGWSQKAVVLSKGKFTASDSICNTTAPNLSIWKIDSEEDVVSALDIATGSSLRTSLIELLGQPDEILKAKNSSAAGEPHEVPVGDLIDKTGVVAQQICRDGTFITQLTVESDLQVIFLTSGAAVEAPATGTAWVTSMKTGMPVEGATVQVFEQTLKRDYSGGSDYTLAGSGTTDSLGRAVIPLGDSDGHMDALVEYEGKYMFVPRIVLVEAATSGILSSLVFDKALVKPSEDLHIKGYIMEQKRAELVPPAFKSSRLVITPSFNRTKEQLASTGSSQRGSASDIYPVTINEEFGTFELLLPVPLGTPYTDYQVAFEAVGSNGEPISGAIEQFSVGDPRPPTVELALNTPDWALPDSEVEIDVSASSLIGSSVGGAEITLAWRINDPWKDNSEEDVSGENIIVTEEDGSGSSIIDLSVLPFLPSPGSGLEVIATWVGPTREHVERKASIVLSFSDIRIDLGFSVLTDLPDVNFGVRVNLTDLEGQPLDEELEVTIQLKRLQETDSEETDKERPLVGLAPFDAVLVEECIAVAGAFDFKCRFAMPSLAEYVIEVCHESGDAMTCRREFIGKASKFYQENPFQEFLDFGLSALSGGLYNIGDEATFVLDNPYKNVSVFLAWGSELGMKQKVSVLEDNSLNVLSIPIDEQCAANCALTVTLAVPRQSIKLNEGINIHPLFDPGLPHTRTFYRTLEVNQDRGMDIKIDFPELGESTSIEPGESTSIKVTVDAESAEITVIVVDMAVLELAPLPLRDLAHEFVLDLAMRFSETTTSDFLVHPEAIDVLLSYFETRTRSNPWAEIIANLIPVFSNRVVGLAEEDYFDLIREHLTVAPEPKHLPFHAAARSSSVASAAVNSAEMEVIGVDDVVAESHGLVRRQKKFISTPLFKTVVVASGTASVNFTAPNNIGKFVVRAFATTGDGIFGSSEEEIIIRKPISLTPSSPRFARVDDEFEAGVIVTVSEEDIQDSLKPIPVKVMTSSNLELVGPKSVTVDVGEDFQDEVRFRFKAKAIGEASMTFTAVDANGWNDSLVISLEVHGLQERVTFGSSLVIDAGKGSVTEALHLPDGVPGTGKIDIQAGVGQLPSILAIAQQLYTQNMEECPVNGDFALAAIAIPVLAESYGVLSSDGSSMKNDTMSVARQIEPVFERGIYALGTGNLTHVKKGLQYNLPCPKDIKDDSSTTLSILQNARGLWMFRELENDFASSKLEVVMNATEGIESVVSIWEKSVGAALIQSAIQSRATTKFPLSATMVAIARSSLGADWAPESVVSMSIHADVSLDRLSEEFDEMPVEGQAYYVLARLAEDPDELHPDVNKAINMWESRLRVGGRTAYISAEEGSAAAASNVGNALVLLAMVKAGSESPLLSQLAGYVSAPPVGQNHFRVFSNFDKLVAMIAIRQYDIAAKTAIPDVQLSVNSGAKSLLKYKFAEDETPVASSSKSWGDLDASADTLTINATGEGEVSLSFIFSFVPQSIIAFPTYNGLFVQQSIQMLGNDSGNGEGLPLETVPVRSHVVVSVQVTTPNRLGSTTIRVMMPAGLEPLDPNLGSNGGSCAIPFFEAFGSRFSYSCPQQEITPSVVTFTYNSLFEGTHMVTLQAIAATAGKFTFPPTRAFVNDQPEVMGLSAAGHLTICDGDECESIPAKAPPTVKSCSTDCNHNGGCNLGTGRCLCLEGFEGINCDKFN